MIHGLDMGGLSKLGFKYVVVHKNLLSEADYITFRKRMEMLLSSDTPFWEDEEVLVYRIKE